jgi:hypothetical protein
MAKQYGCLPSECLKHADTFDIMVLDVATTYEKYISDKQNKKVDPNLYREDDLKNILKKARNEN